MNNDDFEKTAVQRAPSSDTTEPLAASAEVAPDELLMRARRLLARGDAEAAEGLLWQTFRAAHEGSATACEIEAAALLGELLVTQASGDTGARLLHHCLQRIAELPSAQRARFAAQRQTAERYLAELEPVDPRFVEWAD